MRLPKLAFQTLTASRAFSARTSKMILTSLCRNRDNKSWSQTSWRQLTWYLSP